jgi:D-3-phosphoglycerate dehydrogenase
MLKILVLHQKGYERDTFFPDYIKKQFAQIGEVCWNDSEKPYTEDSLLDVIADKDICIGGWSVPVFTNKILDRAVNLKFIGQVGGSVRHYVTPEVFERNIMVTNAAEGIAKYVAEGALLLILALLKDVVGMNRCLKDERSWPSPAIYTETLFGKKVGLIGLGKVGRYLVSLLKPFNVKISLYDPYISESTAAELGIELTDLDSVLMTSDVISIHAPKTKETENMLNLDKLKLVKDGAALVNTARAWIIDEIALIGELKKGRFKAALDVFWQEPLSTDNELRKLPNVILTPHNIGGTSQVRPEQAQMVIDDLKAFLQGKTPKYVVTRQLYDIMT